MLSNILVTGCAGFIGSHTVDKLVGSGYSVVGLDLLTYAGNINNLSSSINDITFYEGDICDSALVKKIVDDHDIGCIINFAAETHVDNSIVDASEFIRTNVEGVRNLLDVCKNSGTLFFQISTDEVYGSCEIGSFSETDKLEPRNPYSASKAAAEHLVTSYRNTFDIDYLMVRMSNNFGPRQNSEKFIPTILNSLSRGDKIPIYGDGKNVRDWLYVKDCAEIICKLLELAPINQTYNISFNNERENIYVVNKLLGILELEFDECATFVKDRPGHDFRYSISSKKMKSVVKVTPTDFTVALKDTVEFYCAS